MLRVEIGLDAQIHDEFIESQPLVTLLQTSKWAQVKDSWDSEIIGFYRNEQLVASLSVLIRPLPAGFTMLYIPRGICMDYGDRELVEFVLSELKKYGKSKKALFVKFDPAIHAEGGQQVVDVLASFGVKYSGLTAHMKETIQPRYNGIIYKEDFSEEKLDKKTKQFIRKGRNSYPKVTYGGKELVPVFAELMKKTEARKQVSLRDADYYRKLLDIYGSDAFITLIEYDMGQLLQETELEIEKIKSNQHQTKHEKRAKALAEELERLEKNKEQLGEITAQHGNLIPVAGTLTINAFGAAETLYAGTDTDFQKYYPSYMAWLETINHTFEIGARTLNMGGLENSLSESDGLLKFKKHFLPRIEEYVGEFDLPVNKVLFGLAQKVYKRRKMG